MTDEQTAEWMTESAIEPDWSTREDHVAKRGLPAAATDERLGDDRPVLGLVMAQVLLDRAVPVDVAELRPARAASSGRARR